MSMFQAMNVMEPLETAEGSLDDASWYQLTSSTKFLDTASNASEMRQAAPDASLSQPTTIFGYSAAPYQFDSAFPAQSAIIPGLGSVPYASLQPQFSKQVLNYPSPSDWEEWKPEIIRNYKHGTARMILKELCKHHYVTEKMLRQRLKRWGVNNKNKKPLKCREPGSGNRPYGHGNQVEGLPSTSVVQRPVSTSPEDFRGRQLLKSMDDYLEHAWEAELPFTAGEAAVSTLDHIYSAVCVAVDIDSPQGWSLLKEAGNPIHQADFSRISPSGILFLVGTFCKWQFPQHTMRYKLFSAVSAYLLHVLGRLHPVSLLLDSFLRTEMDLTMCRRLLVSSDVKAIAHSPNREEMDMMFTYSRLALIDTLFKFEDYETMEEVLDSWSPTSEALKGNKLLQLAFLKLHVGQYDSAQVLCSAALLPFKQNVRGLMNTYDCYTESLCCQARYEDAFQVFLNGLDRIEQAIQFSGRSERIARLEWLRMKALNLQSAHRDFRGLEQISERLHAMSLGP